MIVSAFYCPLLHVWCVMMLKSAYLLEVKSIIALGIFLASAVFTVVKNSTDNVPVCNKF